MSTKRVAERKKLQRDSVHSKRARNVRVHKRVHKESKLSPLSWHTTLLRAVLSFRAKGDAWRRKQTDFASDTSREARRREKSEQTEGGEVENVRTYVKPRTSRSCAPGGFVGKMEKVRKDLEYSGSDAERVSRTAQPGKWILPVDRRLI